MLHNNQNSTSSAKMTQMKPKEPINLVHQDAIWRNRINAEVMSRYHKLNKMYTQIETEQGEWRPLKKTIDMEKYEPYTYDKPKEKKQE